MMRLIDTPEFQRLRRIKQLGLGLYTYQGAEHSRFTHSLGAFHLMTRVLDRLSERYAIAEGAHAAARAAALLHDVGPGSFSHVMEKVLGFHHESWTVKAVLRSILRRALQLLEAGEEVWYAPGTAFEKALRRESLSVAEHLEMDDSDVIFHVKQWQRSGDPILRDLSHRFVGRRLFKAIDL